MLGFNVLPGILLLSCIFAVYAAPTELSPKEEVSTELWRKSKVPTNVTLATLANGTVVRRSATPLIKDTDTPASIQSALTGYDIVIGDPINVIDSGTVRDKGIKEYIFQYDPAKKDVQVSTMTGCSSVEDASVISTMETFRGQLDTEASVSGSISGSGFGVSASFSFAASASSTKIEDHMTKKHGSLTMFTMTCSFRHLSVGSRFNGLPPYNKKFANFITRTLGRVSEGDDPESVENQKTMWIQLIKLYGTHYVSQSEIGARVTTTNFLSQSLTSTMSQSKIKACASASAAVDYLGTSGEVEASGCSASDKSKFNSNEKGVTKTIKNSYGTTKVAGEGSKFSMDQMKNPRPLKITLTGILDLLKPEALRYGIPGKFGDAHDADGAKARALSTKILSWLEPMFEETTFKTNYCEYFGAKIPNCGEELVVGKKRGCGYTGSCGVGKKCVNIDEEPKYRCDLEKWYCVVTGGRRVKKTFDIEEAQAALSVGSRSNPQAIFPMDNRKPGDPHTLEKSWEGGSMWWGDWNEIKEMRNYCNNAPPPKG